MIISRTKQRVLFVGEGVTLAHVVRPLHLAATLNANNIEPTFSCDLRYRRWVDETSVKYHPLPSINPKDFLKRAYKAEPLFTLEELKKEVRDDLRLLTKIQPSAIVSDFRLSMGISAELCGIPLLTLSNAHWSPTGHLPHPVPEHPMVNILGVSGMRFLQKAMLPYFFKLQARYMNKLRASYGLPLLKGRGAHEVFTCGTKTVYLDIPKLYNLGKPTAKERYIGPVLWEPKCKRPAWWHELPQDKPIVYLTAGSSGGIQATLRLINILAKQDLTLMVATAGRFPKNQLPANVFSAEFLPGTTAAKRADLIIGNGGSGLVYQAIQGGTPMLGIPFNMDQYYTMEAFERRNAGLVLRPPQINEASIEVVVSRLLNEESFSFAARKLKNHLLQYDSTSGLSDLLQETIDCKPRESTTVSLAKSSLVDAAWK